MDILKLLRKATKKKGYLKQTPERYAYVIIFVKQISPNITFEQVILILNQVRWKI